MKRLSLYMVLALTLLCSVSWAQSTGKLRKYKTFMEVPIRSAPSPDAPKIGKIAANVSVETTEREDYWVKVKVKGVEGWVASTMMERVVVGPPAPELDFFHHGYKIIGSTYRYFFAIKNDGTASYKEKITLRIYTGEKVVFSETYSFSEKPIEVPGGRSFYVDLDMKADKYEFETKDGKVNGEIGNLIERVTN